MDTGSAPHERAHARAHDGVPRGGLVQRHARVRDCVPVVRICRTAHGQLSAPDILPEVPSHEPTERVVYQFPVQLR